MTSRHGASSGQRKIRATTVATTMIGANLAGIDVFVTGGIGGVHRGYEEHMDVSADLEELAKTSVTVVCAGAKAILDLPRTLENLETKGDPVLGYGTDYLPAFFSSTSDNKLNARVDSPEEVTQIIKHSKGLAFDGRILVANPIPKEDEIPAEKINEIIEQALVEEKEAGVKGKGEIEMYFASFLGILITLVYVIAIGLGLYIAMLAIKALKIYIRNNS